MIKCNFYIKIFSQFAAGSKQELEDQFKGFFEWNYFDKTGVLIKKNDGTTIDYQTYIWPW